VPSTDNAEPTSPIFRQDAQTPGTSPQPDATNPAGRAPQMDPQLGGGGGSGGRGVQGNSSDPLEATEVERPNSISDEPERLKRGGGAAGANLADCMQIWDPSTHMSKEQWATTCKRLGR
jgi:hypothetical protein